MARQASRSTRRRKAPPASSSTAPASGQRLPWAALGLIALTAAIYFQVRHFAFVNWDDPTYVTENRVVLGGFSWAGVRWAFTNHDSANWHPVTWLSHLADVTTFGLSAGAHHLVSATIHAANVLLVFWGLRRLTGSAAKSLVVAALFAVHPLHVESVAWISERKDVLSSLLELLAFGAYACYAARPSAWRYAGVGALFALALMAKPMVVTFPVLLLVLDFWPLQRIGKTSPSRLIVEKVPLAVIGIADSVVTAYFQSSAGAMANLTTVPIGSRIQQATVNYAIYLRQTVWPVNLAAFYPQRPISIAEVLLAAGLLVALTAWCIAWRRRAPYLAAGWAWYLVAVAPVVGLVQTGEQAHADRYMYLGILGLLTVLVWGVSDALSNWTAPEPVRAGAAGVAVVVAACVCYAQVQTWANSLTLWQHAANVTEGNYKAFEKLGEAYRDLGNFDAARTNYEHAAALAPPGSPLYLAAIHEDVGLVLMRQGRMALAKDEFATAISGDPSNATIHLNLGNAFAATGDLARAGEQFNDALRLMPAMAEAHVGLGNVLLEQGRADDAIGHFTEALREVPDLPEAYNGRGAALFNTGQAARALADFDQALRLRHDFPDADVNAAAALITLGRYAEARGHLEAALRVRPDLVTARQLLAKIGSAGGTAQ